MLKQIRNNVELILNERIEARQKELVKTDHGERQINFGYMKVEKISGDGLFLSQFKLTRGRIHRGC